MGLWSLLGIGRKNKTITTITSLVLGEDRTFDFVGEESTGVYLVNRSNLLAYDSYPPAIGSYTAIIKGKVKECGQICIEYEPMSRPWSFPDANWLGKETCRKKDVVLANARAEGFSLAIQRKDDEDNSERMQTILLLLIGLFAIVILIFVLSSGLLTDIHIFPGG